MQRPQPFMSVSSRAVLLGIAGTALAAVVVALVTQHVFDMQPCPWCVLQRLIFVLIALVALVGLGWRSVAGRRSTVLGLLLLAPAVPRRCCGSTSSPQPATRAT